TSALPRTPPTLARSLMRSWACNGAAASSSTASAAAATRRDTDGRVADMAVASVGIQPRVEEPAQPAHRVGLGDGAAAAVDDAGVGHPAGGHGVVGGDVRRPHDALHLDQLVALVEAQVLAALDHQVAIGQALDDGHGDAALQAVALRAAAVALEVARAV